MSGGSPQRPSVPPAMPNRSQLTEDQMGKVLRAITLLEEMEGASMKKREQYVLTTAIAAGRTARVSERCNFRCYIKEVMLHFPPGCVALVDMALGHSSVQYCPRNGFLPLDAATPILNFNEFVNNGEDIWMDLRNRDALNPHTITATVTVEEE